MKRLKKDTKRKIAGIVAGFLALSMLISAISVVTIGLSQPNTSNVQTETTTKEN